MRIKDAWYPATLAMIGALFLSAMFGLIYTTCEQSNAVKRVYTQYEHQWLSTCVSMGESLWRCQWKLANLNALNVAAEDKTND